MRTLEGPPIVLITEAITSASFTTPPRRVELFPPPLMVDEASADSKAAMFGHDNTENFEPQKLEANGRLKKEWEGRR